MSGVPSLVGAAAVVSPLQQRAGAVLRHRISRDYELVHPQRNHYHPPLFARLYATVGMRYESRRKEGGRAWRELYDQIELPKNKVSTLLVIKRTTRGYTTQAECGVLFVSVLRTNGLRSKVERDGRIASVVEYTSRRYSLSVARVVNFGQLHFVHASNLGRIPLKQIWRPVKLGATSRSISLTGLPRNDLLDDIAVDQMLVGRLIMFVDYKICWRRRLHRSSAKAQLRRYEPTFVFIWACPNTNPALNTQKGPRLCVGTLGAPRL